MRASHLLLAGICVGAALTYALFYEPALQETTPLDNVEDPSQWSTAMED